MNKSVINLVKFLSNANTAKKVALPALAAAISIPFFSSCEKEEVQTNIEMKGELEKIKRAAEEQTKNATAEYNKLNTEG